MNIEARGFSGAPFNPSSPRVVVIGSGMSGILMGIRLKKAGIETFTIYEKTEKLGGTWRENTYPGITCDVASHNYCYTFEPNPDWSHRFPPGAEIQAYFERVADKYGIYPHIKFNKEVAQARWDNGVWQIDTKDGEHVTADILISAAGVLHHPNYPDIAGLKTFKGAMFHTARWDHSVDLTDKRVGIIGTGSTAAQIVPAIVGKVRRLTLFQRTAQWIHPFPDKVYSDTAKRWFRRVPLLTKMLYHWYARLLEKTFGEVVVGKRSAAGLNARCLKNLERVRDPELRRKLTPDYTPGCKRLIFSSLFYPAIQKPNAELVTDSIDHIEPEGVVTKDGRLHELDVLVLSTGFKADRFLRPMEMTGENGVTLENVWQDGPTAYRSVAVPGMPNFFMLVGPHSPVGNLSLIAVSEYQAGYIMQCIDEIRTKHVSLAPKKAVTERLDAGMKEAVKNTVWVSGCKSWYLGADGLPALYPWAPSQFYREMSLAPDFSDFEVKLLERPAIAA